MTCLLKSSPRPAWAGVWGAALFFCLAGAHAAGAPAEHSSSARPAPARAADAPAHHGGAAGVHGRVYRTVSGDTADRVVKKALADIPLKDELLRDALIQANPKAFASGPATRLKAGVDLILPEPNALLRQVLLPVLSPSEVGAYFPPPPTTADERRRWVRYP